jgi:hypothetical protein
VAIAAGVELGSSWEDGQAIAWASRLDLAWPLDPVHRWIRSQIALWAVTVKKGLTFFLKGRRLLAQVAMAVCHHFYIGSNTRIANEIVGAR